MTNDKSRLNSQQRSAPATPDSDADSLDFSHIGSGKAPAPASGSGPASVVPPRKTTGSSDRDKAGGFRRVAVPALIILAIALVVALATSQRSSTELVAPYPSAAPSPTYQSPTQTDTASPKARRPPPPASTPPRTHAPIPPEFLKSFQEYTAKSDDKKAMALALDSDGRSAYVSVYGYSTQSQANDEALSECMRFKVQWGVQENCRLYAAGDEVVW